MRRRPAFRDGMDPVGPFHPYLVFAAVILIDLAVLLLLVAALVWVGDRIEDLFWPGGEEWIDF